MRRFLCNNEGNEGVNDKRGIRCQIGAIYHLDLFGAVASRQTDFIQHILCVAYSPQTTTIQNNQIQMKGMTFSTGAIPVRDNATGADETVDLPICETHHRIARIAIATRCQCVCVCVSCNFFSML